MWEKRTPFWREAHFEVKMLKTLGVRTTFGGSDVPLLRFTTLHYTRATKKTSMYCLCKGVVLHHFREREMLGRERSRK